MGHLKKRYVNYCIGIGIYMAAMLMIFIWADGFHFDKVKFFFLFECFFLPGCVVFANYIFDKQYSYDKQNISEGLRVLIKILLSVVVIILATIIDNEIGERIGFYDDDVITLGEGLQINAYWTNVVTNTFILLVLGIPAFVRENIIDKKNYELLGLNTEIDTLKLELYSANVKPHFIFNTLNGIVSLIPDEPAKAEKMTLHLSDFLRSSLYGSNLNSHTVTNEFAVLNDYLNIEQIRFNDNFEYHLKLDDGIEDVRVPKFFLLPIVENAIKHNRSQPNLQIEITCERCDGNIVFEVADSGTPFPEQLIYNDGLNGTVSLLKSYFGSRYKLALKSEPKKVVRIEISENV